MSNLLWSLPLLNCPFDKMCHTSAKAYTLCRVFSGLVQTCQPSKGKKCEILNLELGKVVQRNGHKGAAVNYGAKQGSWTILLLKDNN